MVVHSRTTISLGTAALVELSGDQTYWQPARVGLISASQSIHQRLNEMVSGGLDRSVLPNVRLYSNLCLRILPNNLRKSSSLLY